LLETRVRQEEAVAALGGRDGTGGLGEQSARLEMKRREIKDLDSRVGNIRLELTNRKNYDEVMKAHAELIEMRAVREATEQHRREVTAKVTEVQDRFKTNQVQRWEVDKVLEETRGPVPQALIEQKRLEIAARPEVAAWPES
jgi:hypothetical protein